MKDKTLIIAEARQKAEDELTLLQAMWSRYTWLAVGFGLAFGLFMSFGLRHHPFPVNYIPLVIAPILAYFGVKSSMRPYTFSARHAIEILDAVPIDASDYAHRAVILSEYEFYEAAIEDYKTALAMPPDDELDVDVTWFELAGALHELDRDDEAQPILEKLCKTEGNYQDIALALQGKLLAEKDPAAALKCFDKAIEIEPNDYTHHLARLRFYINTDQFDRAEEAVKETTKLLYRLKLGLVGYAELFELRGVLAQKQGRFADAVKALTLALRYNSKEKEYYRLRADAHEALGNIDKTEKDRRKVQECSLVCRVRG